MHLMVAVWLLFAALLFVIEPLVMGRLVRRRARLAPDRLAPERTLAGILWLHRALLVLSLLTIFAAVGGSYGLF
jgi:hypothetical protein